MALKFHVHIADFDTGDAVPFTSFTRQDAHGGGQADENGDIELEGGQYYVEQVGYNPQVWDIATHANITLKESVNTIDDVHVKGHKKRYGLLLAGLALATAGMIVYALSEDTHKNRRAA